MNKTEIDKARDYVRLNAKNLTDIHKLMVEVNAEVFKLIYHIPEMEEGNFQLINVDNYHNAPIGKRTNWGGYDKDYPTTFVGWRIMNSRGTIRTMDGKKPKDNYIKLLNEETGIHIVSDSFWTTSTLQFSNGINTGTFNGGPDFMGCFRFFIDDFPHLKYKMEYLFSKHDIMKTYKIKDWKMFMRHRQLAKLTSKFTN